MVCRKGEMEGRERREGVKTMEGERGSIGT